MRAEISGSTPGVIELVGLVTSFISLKLTAGAGAGGVGITGLSGGSNREQPERKPIVNRPNSRMILESFTITVCQAKKPILCDMMTRLVS
jgi:hypothetical protein